MGSLKLDALSVGKLGTLSASPPCTQGFAKAGAAVRRPPAAPPWRKGL